MSHYLLRRLLLLPITLFAILLVNFVIINLAPGDPTTVTDVSEQGATRKMGSSASGEGDLRYLQFREFYGLTLPILWNLWPLTTQEQVDEGLWQILHRKRSPSSDEELSFTDWKSLRTHWGDRARFVMPQLLKVMTDSKQPQGMRALASRFFVRGGIRQATLGPNLTLEQQRHNQVLEQNNHFLRQQVIQPEDSQELAQTKVEALVKWFGENRELYQMEPSGWQKVGIFFKETRFFRYMSRALTLDFGTLRNDPNKTVVSEVVKRFKYSLTLSLIPMMITLIVALIFGGIMTMYHNSWLDRGLNMGCLLLYAIPIFVMAPWLIAKVAMHHHFPWSGLPIPLGGFQSSGEVYQQMTSWERLQDIARHLMLPLTAITYGGLAAQSRLARTTFLEVAHQDYVRTAKAKGLNPVTILVKHIGRNGAITMVTAVASSLGVVLGGSLIVETLFDIPGFGKFFYDGVVNRDYNVTLFSAIAGSFLTLVGYLLGDLLYMWLDPRIRL